MKHLLMNLTLAEARGLTVGVILAAILLIITIHFLIDQRMENIDKRRRQKIKAERVFFNVKNLRSKSVIFEGRNYLVSQRPVDDLKRGEMALLFNDIDTKPMLSFVWSGDNPPPSECVIYRVLREPTIIDY
jgi:hypothetical protein